MFKNTKFYALALLVTAASVSFASEVASEAVANPVEAVTLESNEVSALETTEEASLDAAPKKECKYKRFVFDNKKSFIAGGATLATIAAVIGFVYNKRKAAR